MINRKEGISLDVWKAILWCCKIRVVIECRSDFTANCRNWKKRITCNAFFFLWIWILFDARNNFLLVPPGCFLPFLLFLVPFFFVLSLCRVTWNGISFIKLFYGIRITLRETSYRNFGIYTASHFLNLKSWIMQKRKRVSRER